MEVMQEERVVNAPIAGQAERRKSTAAVLMQWLAVLALVYLLLVAVGRLSRGFTEVSGGAEEAERIFAFASHPVMGVIVGVLATALVQSSGMVTSVIVGLVAGGLPVAVAIPMIRGSNMGTTVTNTIVSLGNLRDDQAFNRSFGASVVHDFFNLYSILIFLPIEILYQPLERMAGAARQPLPELFELLPRPIDEVINGLRAEPAQSRLVACFQPSIAGGDRSVPERAEVRRPRRPAIGSGDQPSFERSTTNRSSRWSRSSSASRRHRAR